MSVRNKLVKVAFYVLLTFYMFLQSYGIGLLLSSLTVSIVLAIWSIIKPLPLFFMQKMWLAWLLTAVPYGIVVYVHLLINLIKANSKKNNKEDNGNQ